MIKRKGFDQRIELGEFKNKKFFLGIRVDDPNSPKNFAVIVLVYPEGKEIVKIDMSEKEEIHIHKFWRKKKKKEKLGWYGTPLELWGKSITFLWNNWKKYAWLYLK